jgi:hypothetical protein
MWNLTLEKKEELLRKKQEKHLELEKLRATSKEHIWRDDLTEFLKKLDEVEQKQLENQEVPNKKNKKKEVGRKKANMAPSPVKGIRIVPQISGDLKKKASAAVEKKEKKNQKDVFGKSLKDKMAEFDEPDEFDDMADDKAHNRSLSDRLGFTLKAEEKTKEKKAKRESSEKNKKSNPKKVESKTPWDEVSPSDSDLSSSGFMDSDSDAGDFKESLKPPSVDRNGRERKTVNYKFEEDSNSNQSLEDSEKVTEYKNGHSEKNKILSDSEEESIDTDRHKRVEATSKQTKINTMFKSQANPKKTEPSECDNAFDSLIENGNTNSNSDGTETQNGNTSATKNCSNPYESDSDESPKYKNGGTVAVPKVSTKPKNSNFQFSDSDSQEENNSGSSSDDEFVHSEKQKMPKKKQQIKNKKPAATKPQIKVQITSPRKYMPR